jgi:protein TonB
MKTKITSPEARTLDDIVFSNRNKAYGAYALNKHYRKYLLFAFLISLVGVSTAVAVPFLKALKDPGAHPLDPITYHVIIDPINPDPVMPPPPPPPDLPDEIARQAAYVPPIIVEQASEGNELGIITELLDHGVNIPVINELPDPISDQPEINEPVEKPVMFPQENASFRDGGVEEFQRWVQENVVYPPVAIENGISGKVFISFSVNSQGQVVEVELARGVDKSIDHESIRVISASPQWKAARQGGRPVKQRFTIPVVFILTDR